MSERENRFNPKTIDEQIEQYEQPSAGETFFAHDPHDEQLIHDLQQIYQIHAEENRRYLENAWQSIELSKQYQTYTAQHKEKGGKHSMQRQHGAETSARNIVELSTYRSKTPHQRFAAIVAVLCACLVVGSLAVLFTTAHQNKSTSSARSSGVSTTTPTVSPDAPQGTTVYTYNSHPFSISSVDWSPDSKQIASTSVSADTWDATTGGHAKTYASHSGYGFSSARWSPDGKYIVTSPDDALDIWNVATGQKVTACSIPGVQPVATPVKIFTSSALSTTATKGATTSSVPRGNIDPLSTQTSLIPASNGGAPAPPASWSPNGKYIATGGSLTDSNIYVFDVSNCNIVATENNSGNGILDIEWSPDGRYLAWTGLNNTAVIWDVDSEVTWAVATTKAVYTYHNPAKQLIRHIAWSPDSKRIASDDTTNTVVAWDALTGAHPITYHSQVWIESFAWSPDGTRIVTGGAPAANPTPGSSKVQIWNAATATLLYTYHGNTGRVTSVAWSPNGKYIASGAIIYDNHDPYGGYGEVKVWIA